MGSDFYLRYYVGHKGKFGHEFLEFEFRPDGEVWGQRSGWKKASLAERRCVEELWWRARCMLGEGPVHAGRAPSPACVHDEDAA